MVITHEIGLKCQLTWWLNKYPCFLTQKARMELVKTLLNL